MLNKLKYLYYKTSNRKLAFILLFLIFLFFYLFYYYIFVYSLETLTIKSNIKDYKIELINKKVWNKIEKKCHNFECKIEKIPLLDYTLLASANSYKTIKMYYTPKLNKVIELNFVKEVFLKELEESKQKLTRKQAIEKIKNKKENYFYKEIWKNNLKIKKFDNKLKIFLDDEEIGVLDFENKNTINFYKVYSSLDYFILKLGRKYYLINKNFWNLVKLNYSLDLVYAKKIDENTIWFVSEKWIFLLDLKTKKIDYFPLFSDFVKLDDNQILWIIKNNDTLRKKSFFLEDKKWDLLVKYDLKTKKIYLLKKLWINKNIKIYKKNPLEIILELDFKKFELEM